MNILILLLSLVGLPSRLTSTAEGAQEMQKIYKNYLSSKKNCSILISSCNSYLHFLLTTFFNINKYFVIHHKISWLVQAFACELICFSIFPYVLCNATK